MQSIFIAAANLQRPIFLCLHHEKQNTLSLNKKYLLFVGCQHCSTPKLFEILACFLSNSAVPIIEGNQRTPSDTTLPLHLRTQTIEDAALIKSFLIVEEIISISETRVRCARASGALPEVTCEISWQNQEIPIF